LTRHRAAAAVCSCFDDGFPNLFIENAEELRNKHVAFLASFHSPHVRRHLCRALSTRARRTKRERERELRQGWLCPRGSLDG
jgi:hypothetical protein